jgi:hypothetical protein
MSEFCVSVFTEKTKIINSQIFNCSTYEDLMKEVDDILHEKSYGQLPKASNKDRSEVVKEYLSGNFRWVYLIHPKKDDVIKYFLSIEEKS